MSSNLEQTAEYRGFTLKVIKRASDFYPFRYYWYVMLAGEPVSDNYGPLSKIDGPDFWSKGMEKAREAADNLINSGFDVTAERAKQLISLFNN